MYFEALDSFIKGGATFDSSENSRNKSRPSGLDQTLVEFSTIDFAEFDSFARTTATEPAQGHHEIIFGRLEAKLDLVDSLEQNPQRLFLAKFLKRILACAHKASWPLDKYHHLIDRALRDEDPPPSDIAPSLCLKRSGALDFYENRRETKRRLCWDW
ncbi:uncharacterized protein FTOL_05772 [Fusarium torulosum]|uniref:Uncharacterized protein n=1 Tax=Fusarium torulosum TaxID=33205 RepID=A0AAE8M7Y5_9HYPO|nr:uncharacterized protein FTOL_05772 [Fusarium torulosum]